MSQQPQFLYLTTLGWKSGKEHRIEIWFVELNGRYYIISERLEGAHWVQNIKHNPAVSFSIHDRIFKGSARIVDQEKEPSLLRGNSSFRAPSISLKVIYPISSQEFKHRIEIIK